MYVKLLQESGYEWSALGFSLSYNSTLERSKEILPKYAFGKPGESKFLESFYMWWDVTAPRFFWQEADTYRLSTKQSQSTIHTLMKKDIVVEDFEYPIPLDYIDFMNDIVRKYKAEKGPEKKLLKVKLKNALPEGYKQRRIWCFNYKTLQNIYIQRLGHDLPQWGIFIDSVLEQISHPEFIIQNYEKTLTEGE
jgi:hypothetical protein